MRERYGLRRCKPSAAFVEDELAMGFLDGGTVQPDGEDAVVVAAVQRRRWPMAVFPSLAMPPYWIGLGFMDCRWGVWLLR